MNVYPVTAELDGKKQRFDLKLDVKHIRELTEKTGKGILDLLTDAPGDPGVMGEILDAAIRFKNNQNPADVDGDDLFDLLVDGGTCGMTDWMEIANGIATASGILQSAQANAMLSSVKRRMEKAIDKLNRDEEDTAPSTQKESQE